MFARIAVGLTAVLLSLPLLADPAGTSAAGPVARAFGDPQLKWGPCPPFIPKGCEIAVLNGDPGRENADIFFKVPGNFEIPHHWHTSAERMVLVSGKLHVTYDGHEAVTLKPGMYAYGPAKLGHKASCAKGDPCVLFIAFEKAVDAFATDAGKAP